jgi:uncharacterized DUF497 family protein
LSFGLSNPIRVGKFEWDVEKASYNLAKHGVDFFDAAEAFLDPGRIIAIDEKHSQSEQRYFCIGKVRKQIITVRFTYRSGLIRIIGAGQWRKGRAMYEKESKKK